MARCHAFRETSYQAHTGFVITLWKGQNGESRRSVQLVLRVSCPDSTWKINDRSPTGLWLWAVSNSASLILLIQIINYSQYTDSAFLQNFSLSNFGNPLRVPTSCWSSKAETLLMPHLVPLHPSSSPSLLVHESHIYVETHVFPVPSLQLQKIQNFPNK